MIEEVPPAPPAHLDGGEVIKGLIECVYSLGVLMELRCIASFDDLAAAMQALRERQEWRGESPAKTFGAATLTAYFSNVTPLHQRRRRLAVHDGGSPDDLPPAA
jgi:hypothetical protein